MRLRRLPQDHNLPGVVEERLACDVFPMRDVLDEWKRLAATGEPVGRAVVTQTWGSAPRPAGACLLATPSGRLAGSVSGGCVESATVQEIQAALSDRRARLVSFGVTDETAWSVGLACGGTIRLLVEPAVRPELAGAAEGGYVLATVLAPEPARGRAFVLRTEGDPVGPLPPAGSEPVAFDTAPLPAALGPRLRPLALAALERERSGETMIALEGSEWTVFLEVFARPPTLVIFGGVHIAAALVPLAKQLGYRTVVADGRAAFLTRERFPDADELIVGWPEDAFRRVGLDSATFVCVLTHDPKFDDPALAIALRSPARYVGALGSPGTQTARRQRLREAGLTEEQLARLRGPIGLDLGGREPREIALAILAEMTAVRYGAGGARRRP